MASKTSISNLALAEIPTGAIQDFNEDSKAAAECRRAYAQALGELLEASNWTFATRRLTLTPVTNTRAPYWAYAYTVPSNAAVIQSLYSAATAQQDAYVPTYGQTLAPMTSLGGGFNDRGMAFEYERDEAHLYTDAPNAVVQVTASDVTEAAFPPLFTRALALAMAERILTPLTGDASRRPQLVALYEQARGRAMAADLNRRPRVLDPIPEALMVR